MQLLVNELNHRVKNALAIVQSIVSQSLRGSAPQTTATIEHRLVALAKGHDAITSEHWSGADLRVVLAHVQDAFGGDGGRRIALVGPDLKVPPRLAVSLALVFHELATNAVKHGSLSGRGGTVQVSWTVEQGMDGDALQLEWREVGGPLVTAPASEGFGTRLIQRSARGMGGASQMLFKPEGLVCRLTADLTPDAVFGAA